jgi:nitroreductase
MSQPELISDIEKIHFISNISEKERPPISPVPTETRELARNQLTELEKRMEKAILKAKTSGEAVELDGSKLGGVLSGDIWTAKPDGSIERHFEPNDGLLDGLLQRRTERVADPDRHLDLETLVKLLSYAQWAPNATNEQPTRIMIYGAEHASMARIGELMHKALYDRIVPNISIRHYALQRKKENPNFLPEFSLQELTEMSDERFAAFKLEESPAPLVELPQTAAKLMERGKAVYDNGVYYVRQPDGSRGEVYSIKHLLRNDVTFAKGMGTFFLKFKNTHPYLVVIFRKWQYTSLMTETLEKYGIVLQDVGEAFIDAGFYTDHLALAARGLGLSGVVKTGPMDLAKDELTGLFIEDLKSRLGVLEEELRGAEHQPQARVEMIKKEMTKTKMLRDGLKFGLEAMRAKEQNRPMREALLLALKRGEVYVPATFFQVGYPLSVPAERVRDPRQGKDPLQEMIVYMG